MISKESLVFDVNGKFGFCLKKNLTNPFIMFTSKIVLTLFSHGGTILELRQKHVRNLFEEVSKHFLLVDVF